MKTIKYYLLFVSLFISCISKAQTEDEITEMRNQMDIPELERISQELAVKYKENHALAIFLATQYGWPLTKIMYENTIGYLVGVDDNCNPIYGYNLDAGGNITINSNPLYLGGSLGLNIEGQGLVGGVWEMPNNTNNDYYPLTTHNAFMFNGASRVGIGFEYPGEAVSGQTNTHASMVNGIMIGNDTNFINLNKNGVAKKASTKSFSSANNASEMGIQAANGLLVANHSYEATGDFELILQQAPFLLNLIANGNQHLNYMALSKNSMSVGGCLEIDSTTNYDEVIGAGTVHTNSSAQNIIDNTILASIINKPAYIDPSTGSPAIISSKTSLDVKINISHPKVSDLKFFLVAPNGCGTLELSTNNGGATSNINGSHFNINAIESVTSNLMPFTNKYYKTEGTIYQAPTNLTGIYSGLPSTSINGCVIQGDWKLYIGDDVNGNQGVLTNWSLMATVDIWETPNSTIKPEIVAKALNVTAPKSSSTSAYYTSGGTSFSTPAVSGGALLLQQLYADYNPIFMRSSTIKALMIHTAKEAGFLGPDLRFGYGVLDLEKAAKVIINNGKTSVIQENELVSGDTYSFNVTASNTQPLVATLAWLDPGTQIQYQTLLNDLDLRITSPSGTELPWGLDVTNPLGPAIKLDNIRDNLEKIQIDNPVGGQTYTIQVTHKGNLVGGSQKYSLIVSGFENCANSVVDLTMNNPILANNYSLEYASNSITALNTLNPTSIVKYVAGNEVVMIDGFDGILGSTFDAIIGDCQSASLQKPNRYNPIQRDIILFDNNGKQLFQKETSKPIIYPNPSNGVFTINTNGMGNKGEYEVLDNNGLLILKGNVTGSIFKIDLSKYANGFYFMHLKTDKGIYTNKLIVQ